MNKVVGILIVLLVAAGCSNDSRVSTWVMTGQNTDVKALVGYHIDGLEIGGIGTIHPTDDVAWGPEMTGLGLYIGADATWVIEASDEPMRAPIPIAWLDGLTTVPYGRVEFLDNKDNDAISNLQPQFVGGFRFLLDEKGTAAIAVEYSDGDTASGDVFIGANFRL